MVETITAAAETLKLINEFSQFFLTESNEKEKRKEQNKTLLCGYYLELVENSNVLNSINFNSGIDKNLLKTLRIRLN